MPEVCVESRKRNYQETSDLLERVREKFPGGFIYRLKTLKSKIRRIEWKKRRERNVN